MKKEIIIAIVLSLTTSIASASNSGTKKETSKYKPDCYFAIIDNPGIYSIVGKDNVKKFSNDTKRPLKNGIIYVRKGEIFKIDKNGNFKKATPIEEKKYGIDALINTRYRICF